MRRVLIGLVWFLFRDRRLPSFLYAALPWICLATGIACLPVSNGWRSEGCILFLFVYAALVLYYRHERRQTMWGDER